MRRLFFLMGLLFIFGCDENKTSEKVKEKETETEDVIEEEYVEADDEWSDYIEVEYINNDNYPFNEIDAVLIFSYENLLNNYSEDPSAIEDGNFLIREQNIKDSLVLTTVQMDTLEKILFGYTGGSYDEPDCYLPRHTIVFYKKGKPITFLEICMECNRSRIFDKMNAGISAEKMKMLKDFFKNVGITYFGPHG